MDTDQMSFDLKQVKLKSARQKKRLQKKDLEKQVIQIIRKKERLFHQRLNLPWVLLEKPYQKGWVRCFVLKDKERKLPTADFYKDLMDKINTFQYSRDKFFIVKKGRKKNKTFEERLQLPEEFSLQDWNRYHFKLTEAEKLLFEIYESWSTDKTTAVYKYRFSEPWRFRLQIRPYIITQVKMLDEQLEQDIQLLDNKIRNQNLDPMISKLTGGMYRYWEATYYDSPRDLSLKKIALQQIEDAREHQRQEKF